MAPGRPTVVISVDQIQARSHPNSSWVPPAAKLADLVPTQVHPMAFVPLVIPLPSLLKTFKCDGLRTIFEEKILSTEGLEGKYSDVRDTLHYHWFDQFTRPRCPYIPLWVREVYTSFSELVSKSKNKASNFRLVKFFMVGGKEVGCISECINIVLGRALHSTHPYIGLPIAQSLDYLNVWLAPLIPGTTIRWIETRAPIEMRDLSIVAQFLFGFITNTFISSQNESIIRDLKEAWLGSIIYFRSIDIRLLIEQNMAMRSM